MKYSASFAILGFLTFYVAILWGGWWLFLIWPAISFLVLAVGYGGAGPLIFNKQPDGTIPVLVKLILFPFMLYSEVVWYLSQKLSRENPIDQVNQNLIIGRRLLKNEFPAGIVNYVDLTAEFEDPKEIRLRTNYICLPILDADVPSREAIISNFSKLIRGTTYVHCAQGHGRTCLFAIAYLYRQKEIMSFEEGYALLKDVRPGIGLNKKQTSFIKSYMAEKT